MKRNCFQFISQFLLLTFVLGYLLISCSKDEIIKQTQQTNANVTVDLFDHVKLKDGALCFDSAKYVSMIADSLLKMSPDLRKKWENSIGFVSMYSVIDNAYNELGRCSSIEEYNNILYSYSDVLKVEGEDINQIIPLDFYTSIINREGIYYIGQAVVKITPKSKIIVWSGDKSKLNLNGSNLKFGQAKTEGLNIVSDDVVVIDYVGTKTLATEVGHELYADREHERRKIKFWITAFRDDWGNHNCDWYWQWKVEIKIENWKKDLWWHTYATTCYWEGVDIEMRMPVEERYLIKPCGGGTVFFDPYRFGIFTLTGYAVSSGSSEVKSLSRSLTVGHVIQNNPLPLPNFIWARGKATNRGLGGRFAGICHNTQNCHNVN